MNDWDDEPDIDESHEWDDVYGGDNDPRDWEIDDDPA